MERESEEVVIDEVEGEKASAFRLLTQCERSALGGKKRDRAERSLRLLLRRTRRSTCQIITNTHTKKRRHETARTAGLLC